ncbi:signal peptidase II [Cryobacterium sp. SO2]|uniref:signal peptidase II n=1 Tax=Cryobacterium sp. SO2 TaxID=1897060 RepID=UPI00223DA33F|nr:signal peptidase II [Cryobacterium sp. SO2]WEO79048.1 signal peptidase II [Cryobacterium sp. SO2]
MARSTSAKVSYRALLVLALVACGGYAFDQLSKALVVRTMTEGETARVLGDVLQLHFIRNPGAAFSFATGLTWVFSLIAAGVVVFIVVFARRIRSTRWALVFGLLLGGVLGNLTDRLFREPSFGMGHVVDFIYTPWMMPAIYNIADSCIVVSMVLFMLLTLRGIGLDGRRTSAAEAPAAADAPASLVTPN